MTDREKPIGIFDSGIGGLTVLKEIIREIPDEDTIYLGDTARVPYGIRSAETVIRYAFENTRFLFSKDIKLLVVACNTASSVSLDAIVKHTSIPVIGVIEPGAKAAVETTQKGKVGVIGTQATVQSGAYARAIQRRDAGIEVTSLACPLFVPLVEEGWIDGPIVRMIVEKYLKDIKTEGIDTVVLGCTHYPLLKGVISEVMGSGVTLIDSAVETSHEVHNVLKKFDLRGTQEESARREFYVTDSPERFLKVGEKFIGQTMKHIEKIDIGN